MITREAGNIRLPIEVTEFEGHELLVGVGGPIITVHDGLEENIRTYLLAAAAVLVHFAEHPEKIQLLRREEKISL